eukprot:7674887-Pyramimonas_sp.AAC.1
MANEDGLDITFHAKVSVEPAVGDESNLMFAYSFRMGKSGKQHVLRLQVPDFLDKRASRFVNTSSSPESQLVGHRLYPHLASTRSQGSSQYGKALQSISVVGKNTPWAHRPLVYAHAGRMELRRQKATHRGQPAHKTKSGIELGPDRFRGPKVLRA